MSSHNKYDFYQPNKKISSIDIKDVLSDLIINKNIQSNFKVQHISSVDNIYSNSAVFVNFDKEYPSRMPHSTILFGFCKKVIVEIISPKSILLFYEEFI